MKSLALAALLTMSFVSFSASAKDCRETAMQIALQLETGRGHGSEPVRALDAYVQVTIGDQQMWIASIANSSGYPVGYAVKLNKDTCELVEAPIGGY